MHTAQAARAEAGEAPFPPPPDTAPGAQDSHRRQAQISATSRQAASFKADSLRLPWISSPESRNNGACLGPWDLLLSSTLMAQSVGCVLHTGLLVDAHLGIFKANLLSGKLTNSQHRKTQTRSHVLPNPSHNN